MRTVFRNGTIYQGRNASDFNRYDTMVINDDLIEYIGDNAHERIPELATEQPYEVDLHGQAVFPSFIDGHMHLLQFGASLQKIGLDNCRNLDEIRSTIAAAAKQMPKAARILCRGWRQSSTNREALASMIDDIDPRPIFIDADDLHSEWCNTAALKEMGITRDTPDPVDGIISRDPEGNPTGLISEGAVITMVWPHLIGLMTKDEKKDCIHSAVKEYHISGYTGVVEMAMDAGAWELLEEMRTETNLGIRLAAHWLIVPTGNETTDLEQVQAAIDLHARYNLTTSFDFRIAGIKIICDGVIDACTAALSKPYLVPPYGSGELNWQSEALSKVVTKANGAGLQVALHAIGDAAVHQAVNALEELGSTGRRHRIEHLEVTHPADAKRLGKLGITASVQPVHSDPSILGAWPELIGQERCDWAFAHREFQEHGAQLAFGTDSPTAPHMPLPNMYVANSRKSARDSHNDFKINHRRGLDLHQVFNAASWGAAYSCFAENITGSLEVGKKADFIVLDKSFNSHDGNSLLTTKITQTWMNGTIMYAQQDS